MFLRFLLFVGLVILPSSLFLSFLERNKVHYSLEKTYSSKLPSLSFIITNKFNSSEKIEIIPYDEFRRINNYLEILKTFLNRPEILKASNKTKFSERDIMTYDQECCIGYEKFLSFKQSKPVKCNLCWIIVSRTINKSFEIVGRLGIKEDPTFNNKCENNLYIAIRSDYQGKGLGTKSCKWILEWFTKYYPAISHIQWVSDSQNMPSKKLATKIGFRKYKIMQFEKQYEVYRLKLDKPKTH